MSHPEQAGFFAAVAAVNTDLFIEGDVLEIGSHDVNGTVRGLFPDARRYLGVDLSPGEGVDWVGFGHEVAEPDGSFDLTLSGECFEHDPHWVETFTNMVRLTRPGGVLAFTCASRGRPEHGTRRTNPDESPGTQAEGFDYYRNLNESDFAAALPLRDEFSEFRFWYLRSTCDLYFAGVRIGPGIAGQAIGRLPEPQAIEHLEKLMPWKERVARWPLRPLSRMLPDDRYRAVVRPYWALVLRVAQGKAAARLRGR